MSRSVTPCGLVNPYGQRIATARKLAGLTQEQLAAELGVDVQTIKRRESPKGKEPKRVDRIAIAHVCGVSLDFIEGLVEDVHQATDDVGRKLQQHDRELAALRSEFDALSQAIAEMANEKLRQLEIQEVRPPGAPREDGHGSQAGPGAEGPR